MSKYSKALDKIQDGRKDEKETKPSASLRLPAEDGPADRGTYWERITTLKNVMPDNRVVMLRFPDSVIAEQYRMTRTSLKASLAQQSAKVILVSSSIHSEGKTVSATNTAISLAENGDAKVALIDADLRRGKVGEYLGIGNSRTGLSDLLLDELSPKQVMVRTSLKNLYIMPRGRHTKKPSELVSSNRFHTLVNELRAHFDYVVIDAPPIMSVADAGILAREADGVLFVIQIGRTPKSVVAHSHLLFKQAGVKMFGYVLTNVEYQSSDYRYYSNYYYGQEPDRKNALKDKTRIHLKKAGWNFKHIEDRFNGWWDRKVLKKGAAVIEEESEAGAEQAAFENNKLNNPEEGRKE